MKRNIIIIDNFQELKLIENKYSCLENVCLILLSDNFTLSEIELLKKREMYFFDKYITPKNSKVFSDFINEFLWNWYLDEKGNDLSKVKGLSLGSAFCPSVEILMTTISRYCLGLKTLLKKNDNVYFTNNTEKIFIETIYQLKSNIGFELYPVNVTEKRGEIYFGKLKQILDPGGRYRDLKPIFSKPKFISRVFFKIYSYFDLKLTAGKNILFMPGGKSEKYFEDILDENRKLEFNWVYQFSTKKIFKSFGKNISYFQFYSNKKTIDINLILKFLKTNLSNKKTLIENKLIIKVFEKFLFVYFEDAIKYYTSALNFFEKNRIDLVILSADGYEHFLLVAQAAKNKKIKTALIPHGYYDWGYKELKQKNLKTYLFDYIFCFGRFDYENAILSGVSKKNIVITSFPYFEKFLPLVKKNRNKYTNVLILIPDIMNISMIEKIDQKIIYLCNVIKMLVDLKISIKGIKTRSIFEVRKLLKNNEKFFIYNKQKVPVIEGYNNFDDITNDVDLIIGPQSTALIESGLKGIDYFVYEHIDFSKHCPSIISSAYSLLNIANSFKQLEINILNKSPFKENYSVFDFIDLYNLNSKSELYKKFEENIYNTIRNF